MSSARRSKSSADNTPRRLIVPQVLQRSTRMRSPVPDEYYVGDFQRLTDEFAEIERSVDSAVEDARRVILGRLQAERDRVINEARLLIGEEKRRISEGHLGGSVRRELSFSLNPKFLTAIKRLEIFTNNNNTELEGEPLFVASRINTVVDRPLGSAHSQSPAELPYSIYESMRVFRVIQGKDCLGCVIEKPTCVACLVPSGTNSCAAFSHNGNRITVVGASGQLISTYMICHDNSLPLFFRKIVNLVADDIGGLFIVEEGRGDTVYAFNPGTANGDQSLVVPVEFAKFDDLKSGKISGIAVSLVPGRLLYVSTGLEIRAVSLDDASERVRCRLPPSHQFATVVQCVQSPGVDWRLEGSRATSFLVYTTWNGSELYRSPIFGRNGRIEAHEKHLMAEDGPAPGNVSNVAAAACDLEGNLIVVEQGNHRLQVFSSAGRALCTFAPSLVDSISTCGIFDPRGVAVISSMQLDVTKHRRPVVVVADTGRNSVIIFAPKFR